MQASSRAALCNLVEENLTTLIREAAVVQRHARRARFRAKAEPADVAAGSGGAAAAAAAGSEGGAGPKRRRLLHADDVNMALSCRGSSKLYLTNAGQLNRPTVSGTSQDGQEQGGGGGGSSKRSSSSARAAKINDAVDLNSYLRTEMTLRPPSEIGLRAHWLAVDGVQPDIPENPPPLGTEDGAEGGGLASAADPPRKDAVVHRVEDDEDLEAAAAGVIEGRVEADDGPGAGIVGSVPSAAAATAAAGEGAGGRVGAPAPPAPAFRGAPAVLHPHHPPSRTLDVPGRCRRGPECRREGLRHPGARSLLHSVHQPANLPQRRTGAVLPDAGSARRAAGVQSQPSHRAKSAPDAPSPDHVRSCEAARGSRRRGGRGQRGRRESLGPARGGCRSARQCLRSVSILLPVLFVLLP